MGIILQPFAWLLLFFYNLFSSYGLALILFGIVIKLVLFPVTLKSKKSMIQTTMLSGKMQQLQKQYGKDKERYNICHRPTQPRSIARRFRRTIFYTCLQRGAGSAWGW